VELIERTRCAVTGSQDLETIDTLRSFPVFMGCVTSPEKDDLRADLCWAISRQSGLIQLKKLIPLEVLYPESHGAGGVGVVWEKHHKAFAQFLHGVAPGAVLEVGGGHGILARNYQALAAIPWTILEPNPSPVEGCNARFIRAFFDDKFVFDGPVDAVVHSHVFEHFYEPDQFMRHLAGFIKPGKHLVFTLPNMQVMLERKYTNCLNFEHTIFITEPYIEFLLARHGFRLARKQYYLADHSIFYSAVRDPSVKAAPLPDGLYEKNRKLYGDYVDYHARLIEDLNRKMRAATGKVYLFGAHIFSQSLIEFGLDASRITCLLDNDSRKQGRRLYGTSLYVNSPQILREVDSPTVVLKAGVYNDEIRNDILKNINPAATFLE
jgi:SAM-dependent methyltransferase